MNPIWLWFLAGEIALGIVGFFAIFWLNHRLDPRRSEYQRWLGETARAYLSSRDSM